MDKDPSYSTPLPYQAYLPPLQPHTVAPPVQYVAGTPVLGTLAIPFPESLRTDYLALAMIDNPYLRQHSLESGMHKVKTETGTEARTAKPKSRYTGKPACTADKEKDSDDTAPEKVRKDNSLYAITAKFLSEIEASKDGTLDLNEVAVRLNVQKRRIYDITNVLEGIGLIQKQSKNTILWKGGKSARSKKASAPPVPLRTPFDFSKLDQEEAEIDSLLEQRQAELKEFLIEKCPWTYVNFNDIKRLDMMKDQTIFAIRAQPGTKLEVPDPDTGGSTRRYEMYLSGQHPIDVYLVSHLDDQPEQFEPPGPTTTTTIAATPITPTTTATVAESIESVAEELRPTITLTSEPSTESLFDIGGPAEDLLKPPGDFDYFSLFNSCPAYPVSPEGISGISDFL